VSTHSCRPDKPDPVLVLASQKLLGGGACHATPLRLSQAADFRFANRGAPLIPGADLVRGGHVYAIYLDLPLYVSENLGGVVFVDFLARPAVPLCCAGS